jgi:uroporphyrinogen decarboxylase
MSIVSRLIKEKKIERTPVWMMRQAGRYLPEYMKIRNSSKDFLEMCYSPEIASEITLQPINRFDFDLAVIFSDILLVPQALGTDLEFVKKSGPALTKIDLSTEEGVKKLSAKSVLKRLSPVYEAISLTRSRLDKEKDLVGFVGAPWTLFSYMTEGSGSRNFEQANLALVREQKNSKILFEMLTEAVSRHLVAQIEAGATVVQIFDSWSGEISTDKYEEFVIEPTRKIVEHVKSKHKNIPIIGFPRGSNFKYEKYAEKTGVDVLGIDQEVPLKWAQERLSDKVVLQGNLNPFVLLEGGDRLREETEGILRIFGEGRFIFNLGRGILKHTPIENVESMLEVIRG